MKKRFTAPPVPAGSYLHPVFRLRARRSGGIHRPGSERGRPGIRRPGGNKRIYGFLRPAQWLCRRKSKKSRYPAR